MKCKRNNFSGSGLEWDGSDDYLVVKGSQCSSDEWSHPEDPLKKQENKQSISVIRPFSLVI